MQTIVEKQRDAAARRVLPPHLRRLEGEAIEILREVAATARNPVMMYSIGKDSGVLAPARPPEGPRTVPFARSRDRPNPRPDARYG